jgi:hypothetical protein
MMEKTRLVMRLAAMIIMVAGVLTIGCATGRVNLVENGTVSVEKTGSGNFYISRAYAHQDQDQLVVSGRVKSRLPYNTAGGHVDVAVAGPDGSIIARASARLILKNARRRATRESAFTSRIPVTAPRGSTVHVTYHAPSAVNTFDCPKNAAVPDPK